MIDDNCTNIALVIKGEFADVLHCLDESKLEIFNVPKNFLDKFETYDIFKKDMFSESYLYFWENTNKETYFLFKDFLLKSCNLEDFFIVLEERGKRTNADGLLDEDPFHIIEGE